ncbi:transcriptional regulator, partial [Nocardia rhamnosiphila]
MDEARGSRRPRQPEPPADPGPLTVQDLVDRVDSERTVRRREGDAPRHGAPDGPPPGRAPRPPGPGPRPGAELRPRPEQGGPGGPPAARQKRPPA